MKKFIFSLMAILAVATSAKATIIANYNFTSNLASSNQPAGGTAGTIVLGSGGSWSASGQTSTGGNPGGKLTIDKLNANFSSESAAATGNSYLSFTLSATSPTDGLQLNSISFDFQGANPSKTGSWVLRSSQDSFTANLGIGTFTGNGWTSTSISLSTLNQQLQSTTFRIYVWNSAGTYDIYLDNVAVDGGVVPVPEPTNIALVLFGCTFVGMGAGRKFLKKKA